MFDISFGEILLICVVALVVLGPERLPAVARTLGALVARAQRFVASVKADIGQQSELAGLQSLKQQVQDTALAFKEQLVAEVDEVRHGLQPVTAQVHDAMADAQQALADTAPTTVVEPSAPPVAQVAPPAEAVAPPSAAPATAIEPPATPVAAEDQAPVRRTARSAEPPAAVVAEINENQLDLFAEPSPPPLPHETSR